MDNLVRLADRAARRRAEMCALTLPRFETDPSLIPWQIDWERGLGHLFADILFRDSRGRLWRTPSCGCNTPICVQGRAMYAQHEQSGTGTPSDGSSIPRAIWFITDHPFAPENAISGFIHDDAYKRRRLADGTLVTRQECDQVYREACPFHPDISREAAAVRYRALRAAGWWPWRKHRIREKRGTDNHERND
jgi:hypothetical protein